MSPFLNVTAAATAFPGEEIEIRASHKNLDGFTLRLYQAKKLIKEQHFAVLRPEDYRTQDTVLPLKRRKSDNMYAYRSGYSCQERQ